MGLFTGHSNQVTRDAGPNKRYESDAAENSASAVRHPCYLYDVVCYNNNASSVYLQVFDSVALPANGAVPDVPPVKIPTTSTGSISFVKGRRMMNGVSLCISSTALTKTLVSGTDCIFNVTSF